MLGKLSSRRRRTSPNHHAQPPPLILEIAPENGHVTPELISLRLEPADLVTHDAGCILGNELRLLVGIGDDTRRLLACFLESHVGRALGQHERAAHGFVALADLAFVLLGTDRPLVRLTQAFLEDVEANRDPLEEFVDVVGVVAPELLSELDLAQRLGRDVHEAGWYSRLATPPGDTRNSRRR